MSARVKVTLKLRIVLSPAWLRSSPLSLTKRADDDATAGNNRSSAGFHPERFFLRTADWLHGNGPANQSSATNCPCGITIRPISVWQRPGGGGGRSWGRWNHLTDGLRSAESLQRNCRCSEADFLGFSHISVLTFIVSYRAVDSISVWSHIHSLSHRVWRGSFDLSQHWCALNSMNNSLLLNLYHKLVTAFIL